MPHEFRNLANAPHETLTAILVAGGVAAVVIALIVGYFQWRGSRSSGKQQRKPGPRPARRKRRPR